MQIKDTLKIGGKRIMLVGFWGYQNMGDELILLGNIKLLQKQKKDIYVVSANNTWLKKFLSQFVDIKHVTFVDELPRGFRSLWRWISSGKLVQLKYFLKVNSIILGGGEVLTEESPHSYYYRFLSIWPTILPKKNLYLMGGIQIPLLFWNKVLFKCILRMTKHIYPRDFEEIENLKDYGVKKVDFFMDTSYFSLNWASYKKETKQNYIIVNINRHGRLFMEECIEDIKKYLSMDYKVYFVPVCAGWTDDDARYFDTISDIVGENKNFVLYDWRENYKSFLKLLGGAKKVISARLHLFLISEFIGLETKSYPYQKKVKKMKETLKGITPLAPLK